MKLLFILIFFLAFNLYSQKRDLLKGMVKSVEYKADSIFNSPSLWNYYIYDENVTNLKNLIGKRLVYNKDGLEIYEFNSKDTVEKRSLYDGESRLRKQVYLKKKDTISRKDFSYWKSQNGRIEASRYFSFTNNFIFFDTTIFNKLGEKVEFKRYDEKELFSHFKYFYDSLHHLVREEELKSRDCNSNHSRLFKYEGENLKEEISINSLGQVTNKILYSYDNKTEIKNIYDSYMGYDTNVDIIEKSIYDHNGLVIEHSKNLLPQEKYASKVSEGGDKGSRMGIVDSEKGSNEDKWIFEYEFDNHKNWIYVTILYNGVKQICIKRKIDYF